MATTAERKRKGKRLRLLYRLEAWLEAPMFLLALAWMWLFIAEFTKGLSPVQQQWGTVIWLLFILEYLIKLSVAPQKGRYLRANTLTLIALAIPAFRAFRLLRALRVLRSARVISTTRVVRAFTSTRRLLTDLREAQGEQAERTVNVGVLLALAPGAKVEETEQFAARLALDARDEIENAFQIPWQFHHPRHIQLDSETPRRPSAFLDQASRQMSEGSYDLVLVITDVLITSRKQVVQVGLASPVTRTLVLSTRGLSKADSSETPRPLDADPVRWNTACLLLHLLGHIGGLGHADRRQSELMQPFVFREKRRKLPRFSQAERSQLQKQSVQLPQRELRGGDPLAAFIFHVLMVLRHPAEVVLPLLRSRAILLPFSLPSLATAAVAPALVLVFSAEIWDVGFNMGNTTAAVFATASILGASFYLVKIQTLFFPREEKQTLTEYLAVANAVVFLSILLACIGLFVLVGTLVLLIQFYVFPEDLMRTWPTLGGQAVTLPDKLRLTAFISTIGVTTGALAGGLESRALIQQLALFQERP